MNKDEFYTWTTKIVGSDIDEQKMRDLGFTDHLKDRWYKCRRVSRFDTVNLTIFKDTKETRIELIDELSGQYSWCSNQKMIDSAENFVRYYINKDVIKEL